MSSTRQAPVSSRTADLIPPMRAAAILGVSTDTLRKWCEDPRHARLAAASVRLPSGHYRYSEKLVRAYATRMGTWA